MREGRVVDAGLGYVSSLWFHAQRERERERERERALGYVSSLWFHAHCMFSIDNHVMSFFDNDMLRVDCRDSGGAHY